MSDLPEWIEDPDLGQIEKQLRWALRPLQPLMDDPSITDIHINGASKDGVCQVFVKRGATREQTQVNLTHADLVFIGANAAVSMGRRVAEDAPMSEAEFPNGERIQICAPPAVIKSQYSISYRRGSPTAPTLEQWRNSGVFDFTVASEAAAERKILRDMREMKAAGKYDELLIAAFAHGLNVVFVGSVNSGKTFNIRALLNAISMKRRIITVEDKWELQGMTQPNVVHMLYPKNKDQSLSKHTAEQCIESALRMDMDELVNGEVRDGAAWALLRAMMSGTPVKTSCHSGSAEGGFTALKLMVKQHDIGKHFDNADIEACLRSLIDVVVFSEPTDAGRKITEVYFCPDKPPIPKDIGRGLLSGGTI